MRGWLVVNAFTSSSKFIELYGLLHDAAKGEGVVLERKSTMEVAPLVAKDQRDERLPSFAIFWDKDVRLCRALELMGCRCFNSARAIELCDDKSATYLALCEAGLPQPATLLVPKTFHPQEWEKTPFPQSAAQALGLPLVVKECFGSFGAQVHLAHSQDEVAAVLDSFEGRPALCQSFVQSSKGRDVRLQVVGNRVVAAMERVSATDDFRANVTNGGVARPWTPTCAQTELALRACQALGLDFAGVDLLFGKDGEPLVCEVNSNAHFVNLGHATGVDVAQHIVRHVVHACGEA